MPLFKGRSSLLEVQNQALIKTARERAARINELERDLQQAKNEVERLTLERDFYSKKASELEQEPRTHRGGHQVLPMGSKARTRTRQDRSGWCAWTPVRCTARTIATLAEAPLLIPAAGSSRMAPSRPRGSLARTARAGHGGLRTKAIQTRCSYKAICVSLMRPFLDRPRAARRRAVNHSRN
jgi:hypothetical protein